MLSSHRDRLIQSIQVLCTMHYIYIYREREREREMRFPRLGDPSGLHQSLPRLSATRRIRSSCPSASSGGKRAENALDKDSRRFRHAVDVAVARARLLVHLHARSTPGFQFWLEQRQQLGGEREKPESGDAASFSSPRLAVVDAEESAHVVAVAEVATS